MSVRAAPVDPARVRERGPFVEELLQRPALVGWIGVKDPDGNAVPFSPEIARELLFSMPAQEFATLLRAAGMPQLALRFELGESLIRLGMIANTSASEIVASLDRLRDAGVTAAEALRAVARLLPIEEVERTPRERYEHRMRRRRDARAKHGRSRGRRR